MSKLQRLCTAAALALCALAPPAALAAGKVLYLSTAEWEQTTEGGVKGQHEAVRAGCRTALGDGYSGTGARGTFIKNAKDSFKNAAGSGNFLDYAGTLSTQYQINTISNTTIVTQDSARTDIYPNRNKWDEAKSKFTNSADPDRLTQGDIVVVQTAYQLMDTEKAKFIAQQIKTRKDLTFFLLLDTCNDCSYDSRPKDPNDSSKGCVGNDIVDSNGKVVTQHGKSTANLNAILTPTINSANGWNVRAQHLDGSLKPNFAPNTNSPYYSALNPMAGLRGNTIGTMQCTPKQNVIYPVPTDPSAYTGTSWPALPTSYPELNENSSYGTFVPLWQSNYGKGACLYMATDNNMFDNQANTAFPGQYDNIAQMVMGMYNGACQVTAEQAGICSGINLSAGERCMLVNAPAGTPASELVVQATTDGVCKNQMWKIFPPAPPASVPTTGWPALLGLGALLPLLAARRHRRK